MIGMRHSGASSAMMYLTDIWRGMGLIVRLRREKVDNACLLHLVASLAEVAFTLEAPVETSDDPVFETLYVLRDIAVDGSAAVEGRKTVLGFNEAVDGRLAEITYMVDGLLK